MTLELFSGITLIITYVLLIVFNSIAVFLYHKAYYSMHKTKMIKSVYYLLLMLLFENVYFGAASVFKILNIELFWSFFLKPVFWSVPKLALLGGLIFFIQASLAPSMYRDEVCENCEHLCHCPNPSNNKLRSNMRKLGIKPKCR